MLTFRLSHVSLRLARCSLSVPSQSSIKTLLAIGRLRRSSRATHHSRRAREETRYLDPSVQQRSKDRPGALPLTSGEPPHCQQPSAHRRRDRVVPWTAGGKSGKRREETDTVKPSVLMYHTCV